MWSKNYRPSTMLRTTLSEVEGSIAEYPVGADFRSAQVLYNENALGRPAFAPSAFALTGFGETGSGELAA
jgi:hypothetical protein